MSLRKRATLVAVLATTAITGCQRLDHLGREPSFSPFSQNPEMMKTQPGLNKVSARQQLSQGYPTLPPPDRMRSPTRAEAASHSARNGNTSGSLWSSDPKSLFGDRRARERGDILTVLIEIDDQAELSNTTARSRSGDESMQAGALLGLETIVNNVLPGGGLNNGISTNSSSSTNGQGQVRRNEAISLKVAARVMDILPTGHLVITGRQEVRVNFELRDLQIAGLIRPEDISRNNDITYDKMAEARISYGGRGHISDMQQARYGQQVLDMISPF